MKNLLRLKASSAAIIVAVTLTGIVGLALTVTSGIARANDMGLSLDEPTRFDETVGQESYMPMQTKPQDLTMLMEGPVTAILKSNLIRIGETAHFALDNIRIPVVYDGDALTYLNDNLMGKNVRVYANTKVSAGRKDRYGNTVGHVVLADSNVWVQQDMIAKGLAWADSTATNRDLIIPLLYTENTARQSAAGFWANPNMAVRTDATIGGDINSFQIYEGTVQRVAGKRSVTFINFGATNEDDFTIRVNKPDMPTFSRLAIAIKAPFQFLYYTDKHIRVRGWVSEQNGPMMEVTHPEQIEILREDGTQIGILPSP
jgi:hypothetical protein